MPRTRSDSKSVFSEITSNTNNSLFNVFSRSKVKRAKKKSSMVDNENASVTSLTVAGERYAVMSQRQPTETSERYDGISNKSSSETEADYSYATTTLSGDSTEYGNNSQYLSSYSQSTDYESSDDESCLSYNTGQTSTLGSINTNYIREVKKRTRIADAEYRDSEERRLRSIHLVACRHLRNGNLPVSQQKFEEILSSLVEEYGETHQRVGTALHNLGIVHLRAGNLSDAKDAIQAAVKIRIEKLGEFHPKVADSLVELGIVLIHQNHFNRAVDFFNEALSMRELELEEEEKNANDEKEKTRIQLQIAKIYNNIGCAYFEVGGLDDAKEAFDYAIDIQREVHYSGNNTTMPVQLAMSSTICNLGFVHLENSDWEYASDRLSYALKIQRNVLDDTNNLVMSTMEHLGYSYVKYGNFDASLATYSEIVEMKKSINDTEAFTYLDVGDLEVAEAMKKLVFCQMKLYQYEEAIKTLEEIQAIQEMNFDDDDVQLIKTKGLIASARYELHKHPGIFEMVARNLTITGFRDPFNSDLLCRCAAGVESSDFLPIKPNPPPVRTKMSGHKISYA